MSIIKGNYYCTKCIAFDTFITLFPPSRCPFYKFVHTYFPCLNSLADKTNERFPSEFRLRRPIKTDPEIKMLIIYRPELRTCFFVPVNFPLTRIICVCRRNSSWKRTGSKRRRTSPIIKRTKYLWRKITKRHPNCITKRTNARCRSTKSWRWGFSVLLGEFD